MSILSLRLAERAGEDLGGGATRTARVFLDFVVDGVPLGPRIRDVQDCISRLGWGPPPYRREALAALLLESPPDFPEDRIALFVCPECGDLACGAVTAIVRRTRDTVEWRDFSYESEIDPPLTLEPLRDLGPFVFDWQQYSQALREAVGAVPADPAPPKSTWWHRRLL